MTASALLSPSSPLPERPYSSMEEKEVGANLSGRAVNSSGRGSSTNCSRITCIGQKIISIAGSFVTDTNSLATVFRRINGQVFDAIKRFQSNPGCLKKIRTSTELFGGWVDSLQFLNDISYFYNKQYRSDNQMTIGARVAGAVANAGSTLLWAQELGFVKLGQAAKAISEVRVFSFVPKVIKSIPGVRNCSTLASAAASLGNVRIFAIMNHISIGTIAGRALTLCYLLSAADSVNTLLNGTGSQKTQAGFDLAFYLAELTLDAMLTIGVGNVVSLGVVGGACIATAIARFAYKNY